MASSPQPKIQQTYGNQNKLAPLPVPPLREILEKYLKSVQPCLDEDPSSFENTKRIVAEFIQPGGEGERLHKKLEERYTMLPLLYFRYLACPIPSIYFVICFISSNNIINQISNLMGAKT